MVEQKTWKTWFVVLKMPPQTLWSGPMKELCRLSVFSGLELSIAIFSGLFQPTLGTFHTFPQPNEIPWLVVSTCFNPSHAIRTLRRWTLNKTNLYLSLLKSSSLFRWKSVVVGCDLGVCDSGLICLVFHIYLGLSWFSLPTMWGPQTIAKLVNITPISLWFIVLITIVFMGFINQLITGGPHIV